MDGYMFDYRLGYVRSGCELPGFDVIGAGARRIISLGGYTTPDMARSGRTWAAALRQHSSEEIQVLNGCTDGFSSAQILTMFIRDAILFEPEAVVCLSGYHNIAYKLGLVPNKPDAALLSEHPFATPRQIMFLRNITARFGLGNDEIFYGENNCLPAWELWLRQMAEIKTLCDEFGVVFKVFIQPSVFSGKYKRNERENSLLCERFELTDEQVAAFHEGFQREYNEIAKRIDKSSYIVDLTGIFDGYEDVYVSDCHVADEYLPKLTEGML